MQLKADGSDDRDLQSQMDEAGIVQSTIALSDGSAAGFTREVMAALAEVVIGG